MSKFLRDKKIGKEGEEKVKSKLSTVCEVKDNQERKNYVFFDISCVLDGKKFKIEVKNDVYSQKSGNWAIEFYNSKTFKPSGIMATKAHIWAHITNEGIFITSVKSLKQFCESTKPLRICEMIGDGNADIMLFDKDVIKEVFYRIDDYTNEELKQLLLTLLK